MCGCRKAAREEERQQAAEERGRAALHRLRMERAAKQLTAQLDAELQFRRSAAASATAASSPLAALQPHRSGSCICTVRQPPFLKVLVNMFPHGGSIIACFCTGGMCANSAMCTCMTVKGR